MVRVTHASCVIRLGMHLAVDFALLACASSLHLGLHHEAGSSLDHC